jgi:hypothetical protein
MARLRSTVPGRWALAVMAFVLAGSCLLLAQEVVFDANAEPAVVTAPQLTSTGAVIGASIFLTMVSKKMFAEVNGLSSLPVWLYVVVYCVGLTFLANQIFGTLKGDFWLLAWTAVYNAASATGFREWVHSGVKKPLADAGS